MNEILGVHLIFLFYIALFGELKYIDGNF